MKFHFPHLKKPVTPSSTAGIVSWCVFDWANSAFITLIAGFIFGPYLTDQVAPSKVIGTEYWSWAIAIVGILVAVFAPILGATIDQLKARKPWLAIFTLGNILFTALLFFTKPDPHWAFWGYLFVILSSLCFEFNQVIYNTLLFCIAPKKLIGRISGWGWGFGYFGGLLALTIALLVFLKSDWISHHDALNIRSVSIFVAIWVAVFALPLFKFTPDEAYQKMPLRKAMKDGLRDLGNNFSHLRRNHNIFLYLIAHLFYMDGLNTLLAFSAIYAAGVFHMSFTHIVMLAISLNIFAGFGAIALAWVDDWKGPRFNIVISLFVLIIVVIVMLITKSVTVFWIFALIGGVFIGPLQSSSRSYMVHLVPAQLATQYFGMYELSGRVTAFIGPLLVGALVSAFHSQRVAFAAPVVMLVIGLIMMLRQPKAKSLSPHLHTPPSENNVSAT